MSGGGRQGGQGVVLVASTAIRCLRGKPGPAALPRASPASCIRASRWCSLLRHRVRRTAVRCTVQHYAMRSDGSDVRDPSS